MRFFCGIRSRAAAVNHLLCGDHIEKTTSKYNEILGHSIPHWMARFNSIPTTGEEGHLFTYEEFDIWP